jgi:hypothetical protein
MWNGNRKMAGTSPKTIPYGMDGIHVECGGTVKTSLWRRAHAEGCEKGRKSLLQDLGKKMEDKYEEGIEKGMDLGREQGYMVAKEGFDGIVEGLKARATLTASTSDAGTQTDPPAITTTSVSVQTNPTTLISASQAWEFIETGVDTRLAPTAAVSTQTTPKATTTVSSSVQTNPSTLVGTSQLLELPRNQKNMKIYSTSAISSNLAVFFPQTLSVTVLDSAEHSTMATALKTRSTMTYLTEKHQKVENLSLSPKQPHKPLLLVGKLQSAL